jgi:RNA polymerase Rpb1, domain 5
MELETRREKRKLTEQEITDLVSFIQPFRINPLLPPDDAAIAIADTQRHGFVRQLRNVLVYPQILKPLRDALEIAYKRALIDAGKSVGALASTSIGEKNTQQSLSSFHTSGQQKISLLVGVPRMEELVNVTRDIKTPSMEIWLDYPEEKLKSLSFVREKAFEWLQMREVIDFIVDYNICQNRTITEDENKWYRIHSIFIGEHYENCEWSIRLEFDPKILYQNRMTLAAVVKTIHDNYGDAHCVMSPDNVGIVDVYVDTDELGDVGGVIKSLKDNRRKSKKKREEDDDADLSLLITDENKEYYFLRDLVLPSVLHLQVGGIQGIKQCFFQEMNGLWYVTTNGSNLKAVLSLPIVNGYKTITNHLWDTFELLGSEAARQLLRREFEKVIGVGHRHIELLIDSMTSSGRPQPASSRGINIKDVGLLAKISFEHAWEHFFKGAMVAETDKIRGAASSIVAGNVPPTGSGYMGILDAKSELPIDEDAELYNHSIVMSARSASSQSNNLKINQPANIEIPGGITRRKFTRPSALSKHVAPSPFTPSPGDAGRPRGRSRMLGAPLIPSLLDDTGKEELRRMKPAKSDLFKNDGRVIENESKPEIY